MNPADYIQTMSQWHALAPRVWDHWRLSGEQCLVALDAAQRSPVPALIAYRAIVNSLRR